jgi:hypothetical protein
VHRGLAAHRDADERRVEREPEERADREAEAFALEVDGENGDP